MPARENAFSPSSTPDDAAELGIASNNEKKVIPVQCLLIQYVLPKTTGVIPTAVEGCPPKRLRQCLKGWGYA